jgi:hypothetical protein
MRSAPGAEAEAGAVITTLATEEGGRAGIWRASAPVLRRESLPRDGLRLGKAVRRRELRDALKRAREDFDLGGRRGEFLLHGGGGEAVGNFGRPIGERGAHAGRVSSTRARNPPKQSTCARAAGTSL